MAARVYHALMDPGVLANLRPAELVERARTSSLGEWTAQVNAPLLLVRVDDPEGDVALGLEGRVGPATPGEPGLAFHTVSTPAIGGRPRTIPPPRALATGQLMVRLVRSVHVVVLIGKREEAGRVFAERVTIGRTRNSDIVLRHESVSKFHAWFARDENDVYYIVDASSRNGTLLNGTHLTGGQPAALTVGDLVRFGDVEATYCDAATLYATIHA